MNRLKPIIICLLCFVSYSTFADSLRVYAASSMTNVVTEIADTFEEEYGIKVFTVFGGSASLARQIEYGAPADVFISANSKWMDYLVDQGVAHGDAVTEIIANELVVITSGKANTQLDLYSADSWLNNLQGGRLAIGQTNAVPAGIYAKQSLSNIGVWTSIKDRLAQTNNVRTALTLVERGETQLGIVYRTDALQSSEVKVLQQLPKQSHSKIVYPMALLNDRQQIQLFANFLLSAEVKAIFANFGFQQAD